MFAFAACIMEQPDRAFIFLDSVVETIAGFDEIELQELIKRKFHDEIKLEYVQFFELGKYTPITFEKHVSYTLYKAG